MKNNFRRICAAFIAFIVIITAVPNVEVSAAPSTYSSTSNSGTRNEECTSLSGTSASSYYSGSYTYENLSELSASSLKTSLNTLMTSTHMKMSTYDDCRDKATITDCEENDTSHFTTFYTSYSATYGQYNKGNGWNREHVWPKSLGGFDTSGPGADLHHIRPTETQTNSDRGNLKYGNVSSGTSSKGNLSGIVGGTKGTYYEPLANVKGDVARIILYVHVRYYTTHSQCASVTNVFQSVDVLLDWMELDPVDTWEMGRNEVVQNIQGNRNVFIDYPEYAWLLFDEEIPENMTTPSGKASGGTGTGTGGGTGNQTERPTDSEPETEPDVNTCEHIVTKLVGWVAGDCTNPGYSGDTYCATCDTKLFSGIVTDPTGEHVWAEWRHEIGATIEERECEACGEIEEREYTGPSEETNIATESETDITTDTETATDVGSETDTEVASGTENTDTESETVTATEPETKTEDHTEQNDPDTSETASTTVAENDSGANERETAENKSDAPIDEVLEGCASSLAGGTVIISAISMVALLAIRKKKE